MVQRTVQFRDVGSEFGFGPRTGGSGYGNFELKFLSDTTAARGSGTPEPVTGFGWFTDIPVAGRKLRPDLFGLGAITFSAVSEMLPSFGDLWATNPAGIPRFDGFELVCNTSYPHCVFPETDTSYADFSSPYAAYGCSDASLYTCYPTFVMAAITDATTLGVVTAFMHGPWNGPLAHTVRQVWAAPVATAVPAPYQTAVPLYDPVYSPSWLRRAHQQVAPKSLRRPWKRVDPDGRSDRRPYERPAIEHRWPDVGTHGRRGRRPPYEPPTRVVHRDVPDKARKGGSRMPKGMMLALKLFHGLTELQDAVDALYEALGPFRDKRARSLAARLSNIAENWWRFFSDPGIAQAAATNLIKNDVEDRVLGRLFGAGWHTGVRSFRDSYGAGAYVDTVSDTGMGPVGPWSAFEG